MPPPGSGSRSGRTRLLAALVAVTIGCGALLAGCSSQDAAPLAQQACADVEKGIQAENQASAAGPARASLLSTEALTQIRAAVPFAAEAAGDDTTWQALEATLSESNRVPLHYLLPALSAQCAGVG